MTYHWETFVNEASLAALMPLEYAYLARPIRDGMVLFLSGLREADQAEIMCAQSALPLTATFSRRVGVLAQCCPVLQKLGQVLARDQRLAADFRQHLCELESLPPSVSLEAIEATLRAELGPLERRGVTLAPPAIAEASVAVVIPYSTAPDGAATGVFKILKPGIEERLEQEFRLLERVGEHLDERCDELQIPHLDYQESFQQVREKLLDEVQLENEQRHLEEARVFFADEPRVQIPQPFEHCTSRVTAMERITGGKVTGHGLDCPCKKRRLAGLIAKALLAKPIFSRADQSLFHGDPHAGNLFLTDDGRLAILDWSLAGRLGDRERVAVATVMLGAVTLDAQRIVMVLAGLADARLDVAALKTVVQSWLQRIRRGQFPGLSWLIGLLDDATQNAKLRVGADMMLFRKSLHTLEGVVAEVGESSGQLDKVLLTEFLRHFAIEWPQRWLRLPHSRDFATRLSNLDLTRTVLSYPTTAARFWTGHTFDMLEKCARRCAAKKE